MKHGIVVVGANGSGKTTFATGLAAALGYTHMDIETYSFYDSAIPYKSPRPREEVQRLLFSDMKKHERFVFSAVNGDFGEEINALYDCVIYMEAPLSVRLERVRQRSFAKFGSRVLKGGDLYEQEQQFLDFVATRTMDKTEMWLKKSSCPILYIDGTKSVKDNVAMVKKHLSVLFPPLGRKHVDTSFNG